MSGVATPGRRLFFALWPTEAERPELARRVESCAVLADGRPVPAGNLHVTLEFLGLVPESQIALLRGVGDAHPWSPVTLRFDRIDWWARAAAWVLGVGAPPPALIDYQTRLRSALIERGFRVERRPYRPHMTIARKVRVAPSTRELAAFDWRPSLLALVESLPDPAGSRYTPLADWPADGG